MAESKLTLQHPKALVKIIFTHNQTLEALTDQYSTEDLDAILTSCAFSNTPVKFRGCDESGKPVSVCITQPHEVLSYLIMDYDSFAKMMRDAAQQRSRLVQR